MDAVPQRAASFPFFHETANETPVFKRAASRTLDQPAFQASDANSGKSMFVSGARIRGNGPARKRHPGDPVRNVGKERLAGVKRQKSGPETAKSACPGNFVQSVYM